MNFLKIKKCSVVLFSLFFLFSLPLVFADDDLDGNDIGDSDSSGPDLSDMDNWSDSDWDSFFDSHTGDHDGWDGTSATYGYEANDWHYADVPEDAVPFDYDNYITVQDSDGYCVTIGVSDVYDEDGNWIFNYQGPEEDKAEVEARIAEFFENHVITRSSETMSAYINALVVLNEARKSGADAKTIEELEAKVAELQEQLDALCHSIGYSWTVSANGKAGVIANREGKTVTFVGDPVIFATGEFVIDDSDLSVHGKKSVFSIQRHYSSGIHADSYAKYGFFGQGWTSNLETRIIPCYSDDFIEAIPVWESYIEGLKSYEEEIRAIKDEDSDGEGVYETMLKLYEEKNAEYELIKQKAEESSRNKENCKYVDYGFGGKFANTGMDSVIYVQDNGGILVFRRDSESEYQLIPAFSNFNASLSKTDDGYCISYPVTGETRYYSELGLPVRFTYKNGGKIEFFYDDQMKLSSLSVDGQKAFSFLWSGERLLSVTDVKSDKKTTYSYTDENLVKVTDEEGDSKQFSYNADGIIARQIKADGTFVAFEFAEIDGMRRTTKTTNEEGKSEYFNYDTENRTLVYIDYEGRKSTFVYDETGRTVSARYPDGYFIQYEYDENGLLLSKIDNFGKITLVYDSNGNVTQKIYPDTSSEKWTYNGMLLTSFTDRDGITQRYFYDSTGIMTDIYRSSKLFMHFEYDDGKLSSSTDCQGNKTCFKYDSSGNLTEKSIGKKTEKWQYDTQNRLVLYTDAIGRKTTYSYGTHSVKAAYSTGLVHEKIYSERKLLIQEIYSDTSSPEKRITYYEYDKNKNCIARYISGIDSKGKTVPKARLYDFSYTDSGLNNAVIQYDVFSENPKNWISEFEYDSNGTVYSSKNGFLNSDGTVSDSFSRDSFYTQNYIENAIVSSIQNGDGRIVKQTYDSNNRLISVKEHEIEKIHYEYSPAGRLLRAKNGKGGVYAYAYDSEFGFKTGFIEEKGSLKTYDAASYFSDGTLESYTDRNGEKTQYFYDESKNLVKIASSAGTKEFEYDLCGRLICERIRNSGGNIIKEETWAYDDKTITHISGKLYSETYVCNAFGEIVQIIDGNGNKKSCSYDILGRMITEKDAYGNQTSYSYNGRNQISKVIFRDGTYLQYSYDESGNCICAHDSSGKLWEKSFDASCRVVSYSERPFTCTEYYEYDEFDELVSVTKNSIALKKSKLSADGTLCEDFDSFGNRNTFKYDGFGRLLSWRNSLGKSSETTYSPDGKVNFAKDFNGGTKKFTYGKNGLSLEIADSDGENYVYEYDAAGNLLRASNPACDLRFFYDEGGMLMLQKNLTDGTEIAYTYDSARNVIKLTSSNRVVSYTWGKNGELLSISDKKVMDSTMLSVGIRFVHDSMGRETLRVYDSGESVKSTYDKNGRLILQLGYDASIALVMVDGSVYDENGLKIYSLNSDFSVTGYSYDEFGRLVSVSYPYSEEMEKQMKKSVGEAGLFYLSGSETISALALSSADYDSLQKLCSQIGFVSYQIAPNQSVLIESISYDMNNNITKRVNPYNTVHYTYDSENRLVSWGNNCKARYDDNGNLIYKKTAYSEVTYEYNSSNRVKSAVVIDILEDCRYERKNSYDALGRKYLSWLSEDGSMRISYIALSLQIFDSKKIFSDSAVFSASTSKNRTENLSTASKGRYVFIDDDGSTSENRSLISAASDSVYEILPLYDYSGNIASYFSVTESYGEEKSILMADKTGSVKTEISDNRGKTHCKYDAFGVPVSEPSEFAFIGKKFDSKLASYDFGYRDYEPENARFSSVDPIHDGQNWYAYCGGNPIGLYDKYGLESLATEEQYMQTMGHTPLGGKTQYSSGYNSNGRAYQTDYADKEGCVVTAIAEAVSAFTGLDISNEFVNSHPEFFDNNYNIDWGTVNSVVNSYFGMEHTVEFSARGDVVRNDRAQEEANNLVGNMGKTSTVSELYHLQELMDRENAKEENIEKAASTLAQIENSSKTSVVIAQVAYDASSKTGGASLHFVGISTEVTQISGKSYVAVTATSIYDTAKNLGTNRSNLGWVVKDGKVFVPLSLINRIDTISKPN